MRGTIAKRLRKIAKNRAEYQQLKKQYPEHKLELKKAGLL